MKDQILMLCPHCQHVDTVDNDSTPTNCERCGTPMRVHPSLLGAEVYDWHEARKQRRIQQVVTVVLAIAAFAATFGIAYFAALVVLGGAQ